MRSNDTDSPRILCVDDEPHVLEGLALHLRRRYRVTVANSGEDGLTILAHDGPFAVVMSDMRMPGMDGAMFLAHVRQVAPDATRMLLTGQTDMRSAIAAVNQGQIFRFLTKPCSPDELATAMEAAVEQHRLTTAEKVLLEQTLLGSVRTLIEILSLTSPLVFGRASRIQQLAKELAEPLGVGSRWVLEVAALMSQLGCVALPDEVVRKRYFREVLTEDEQVMVKRLPSLTESLLANIPRLEKVRAVLALAANPDARRRFSQASEELLLMAEILRVASDYDELESSGLDAARAIEVLVRRLPGYDQRVLEALSLARDSGKAQYAIRELPPESLCDGMLLAEDLRTAAGHVLASRGSRVTAGLTARVRNFRKGYVHEPVRVYVPTADPTPEAATHG